MKTFNLREKLAGRRADLLNMGLSEASVGRLLYVDGWLPKSDIILKLREVVDIPFALTGAELGDLMQKLNVSIAHLHRESGVSRGIIGHYLNGKRQLRMDTLQRLVESLPTTPLPDERKLTTADVDAILESTEPISVLAERYDIDPSYISHIRRRHG